MSGTIQGGQRARDTNYERYGRDFYRKIGEKGGKISRGGGFKYDSQFAKEAGRKGGLKSKRRPVEL